MKYVILIHANPDPWGHPTSHFTEHGRSLTPQRRAEADRRFEALLSEISASGELVQAQALGDPASATLYRGTAPGEPSDGPYAETKEHLAGFFVIDCDTRERAEVIAAQFSEPGAAIELRPAL